MPALMIVLIPFGVSALTVMLEEKYERYDLMLGFVRVVALVVSWFTFAIYLPVGWAALAAFTAIIAGCFLPDGVKAVKRFLKRIDLVLI